MNVLFLDAYYEPESIAYTYLEKGIIEGLISAGNIIHIVCPIPTRGISDEVKEQYKRIRHEVKYNGKLTVERFWAPQEGKNPLFRAFRYFWCNVKTYQKAIKQKNIDVIFSNSTPPTQGLFAGMVQKRLTKKGGHMIPFVYNLQDIFPDSLTNTGMAKKGTLIWKIGRRIEDYIYKTADQIIVISEDFKTNIIEKGVSKDKIVVIPNWADTDGIYPVERKDNVLFDRYSLSREKFYISYNGNIGHTQNMTLLLDVAKEVKREMDDVRFILIGDGAAKADVERRINGEEIDNVILLPFQPYEDIAHVFSLGDVGLIISKPGVGNHSVPSKTWGYMAAGKPIIASFDENSELTELIKTVECGITVEADKKDEFINAIRTVKEDSDLRIKGKKGLSFLENKLDKDKCVGEYVRIMEETAK